MITVYGTNPLHSCYRHVGTTSLVLRTSNLNRFSLLTEHIIEALETHCEKCTETQKKGTRRVIAHLINNEEDYWKELCDKYDPERKFTAKYEKELKEIKS